MYEESMTPRERWLAVLQHRKPNRVPLGIMAVENVTKRLMEHFHCSNLLDLWKDLHLDMWIHIFPKYIGPSDRSGPQGSIWGLRFKEVRHGSGETAGSYHECIYHPLAEYKTVKEIERDYTWPSADWYDYSGTTEQFERYKEEYPLLWASPGAREPFAYYRWMRGERQSFIDLIRNPEIVHYCMDKMLELANEMSRRVYEQIGSISSNVIMISLIECDLGTQQDLMYSPAHIREYYIPRLKKLTDLAHDNHNYVLHHDDGAIVKILPELMDAGIDILNPVQWRCKGMEREGLKRNFGDKIVFHGAVDNQYTLPFGSEEEVRQEVRDNIRILGEGGGYVLAPCHNMQSITPLRNILAMYDEAYKVGWY